MQFATSQKGNSISSWISVCDKKSSVALINVKGNLMSRRMQVAFICDFSFLRVSYSFYQVLCAWVFVFSLCYCSVCDENSLFLSWRNVHCKRGALLILINMLDWIICRFCINENFIIVTLWFKALTFPTLLM